MAINSINNFNTKIGANFELMYGQQAGTQRTTVAQNNYANTYVTNFNFKDEQLLARLNRFDNNFID